MPRCSMPVMDGDFDQTTRAPELRYAKGKDGPPDARPRWLGPCVEVGSRSRRYAGSTTSRPRRSLPGNVTSIGMAFPGCGPPVSRSTGTPTKPVACGLPPAPPRTLLCGRKAVSAGGVATQVPYSATDGALMATAVRAGKAGRAEPADGEEAEAVGPSQKETPASPASKLHLSA